MNGGRGGNRLSPMKDALERFKMVEFSDHAAGNGS